MVQRSTFYGLLLYHLPISLEVGIDEHIKWHLVTYKNICKVNEKAGIYNDILEQQYQYVPTISFAVVTYFGWDGTDISVRGVTLL